MVTGDYSMSSRFLIMLRCHLRETNILLLICIIGRTVFLLSTLLWSTPFLTIKVYWILFASSWLELNRINSFICVYMDVYYSNSSHLNYNYMRIFLATLTTLVTFFSMLPIPLVVQLILILEILPADLDGIFQLSLLQMAKRKNSLIGIILP